LTKAIKVVFGDMGGAKAEQEHKALQRIKEVRHPFLLSLERIEVLDGQLLIVTELAEESLADRFRRCRREGLPGIPRPELLGYLRDAADALDYMAETHGLQHLDVKPHNLLLVGGRIKVADFGLVKDLAGTSVTATGGVTPLYAPPEAFDGRVSRHSDQYSLAVLYQEMLTGERPFPGTTVMQLAHQHLHARPLLGLLPPSDRPAMARALSKAPEQRFPTCRSFVEHLLGSAPPAGPAESAPVAPPPALGGTPTAIRSPAPPLLTTPVIPELQSGGLAPREKFRPTREGPSVALVPSPAGLRPTLFLGVGGLAGVALRHLKHRLQQRFGSLEAVPALRLLLLDTNRADLRAVRQPGAGAPLTAEETLLAPLQSQEHYRAKAKAYLPWLERRWLYGIPRSQTTEGIRPLGRLALVDNAPEALERLREELTALTSEAARALTESATGLALRDQAPRVFLVASIAGATGGGMLVALAYAVQQALAGLHLSSEGVCGLLLHATSPKPAEVELGCANAYATLQEISHFSHPNQRYPGDPDHGLAPGGPGQVPLPECYLVQLGERLSQDAVEAATDLVAEYLYLDAATAAGPFLDQYRAQARLLGAPLALRTFGLSRVHFPREQLVDRAARRFCREAIQRWRDELAEHVLGPLRESAGRKLGELGLEENALAGELELDTESILGKAPDDSFAGLTREATPAGGANRPEEVSGPGVEGALRRIEDVLGAGPAPEGPPVAKARFETELGRRAEERGADLARSLVAWLLEQPQAPTQRLKAAELLARHLSEHLRTTIEDTAARLAQLAAQRQDLRACILAGGPASKPRSLPGLGPWLRHRGAEKRTDRLLDYCWVRWQEVVLEGTARVREAVRGELSTFLQELVLSQQKLKMLANQLAQAPAAGAGPAVLPPSLTVVVPGASAQLEDAAAAVLTRLSPELARQLEEELQGKVLEAQADVWAARREASGPKPPGGGQATFSLAFWNLVSAVGDGAQPFGEEMVRQAQLLLQGAVQDVDAAQLFLEAVGGGQTGRQPLAAQLEAARPSLLVPGGYEQLVLMLPEGPAGAALGELVREVAGGLPCCVLPSETDVVLCFEAGGQPLPDVAAALAGADGVYAQLGPF
jgi:hypothetical protein